MLRMMMTKSTELYQSLKKLVTLSHDTEESNHTLVTMAMKEKEGVEPFTYPRANILNVISMQK
jgi:hypothetical protein